MGRHAMAHWQQAFNCRMPGVSGTCNATSFSDSIRVAAWPQEKEIVRLKREAKAAGGFYCEPEQKLLFVVRIKGLNKIHPKVWSMGGGERTGTAQD